MSFQALPLTVSAFKKKLLLTLLIALIGALAGGLIADYLARNLLIAKTEHQLEDLASHTIMQADSSSREARVVLSAMNASPYPACSAAEIDYFRRLILASEYLKEAGRIQNGQIDCSSDLGHPHQQIALPRPNFTQPDGIKVYRQFPVFMMGGLTVVALQLDQSYVIISPYLETHRDNPPIHYLSTAIYNPRWQANHTLAEFPLASRAILTTNGQGRAGDTLYATRCSQLYFNCVTHFITVPAALQMHRAEYDGQLVTGAFIGTGLGLLLSILYRRNRGMQQQLRRAIRGDKLRVLYQPIVSITDRRIVGAEALVRWVDEDGFSVAPNVFVRLAEERGFVGEITRLVIRHALHEMKKILIHDPDFRLSINIAASDLSDDRFLPMLEHQLEKAKVPARSLSVEITESCTAQMSSALETILRLRQRGLTVDIDDFGTGYSNLAYLHDLSVDCIKIDKTFTHAIGTQAVTETILPQILAMAEALNLEVVVEGIETEMQLDFFRDYSQPIYAQGWLFGYPIPAHEFQRRFAEQENQLIGVAEINRAG